MLYAFFKHVHLGCAAASISFFVLRGIWMIYAPARLNTLWIRIVPHIVDTALLASAVALAGLIRQYPFVDNWITTKFFGLILYIILGSVALKRGRTLFTRISAGIGAIAVFGYIVAVAVTKHAVPLST